MTEDEYKALIAERAALEAEIAAAQRESKRLSREYKVVAPIYWSRFEKVVKPPVFRRSVKRSPGRKGIRARRSSAVSSRSSGGGGSDGSGSTSGSSDDGPGSSEPPLTRRARSPPAVCPRSGRRGVPVDRFSD